MLYDKANSYDFYSQCKDLEPPGKMFESKKYKWKFPQVSKACETYSGINVRLRYFVRITVLRNFGGNISKEVDFIVQNLYNPPEITNTIKMEVRLSRI